MTGFNIVSLIDFINVLGEEDVKNTYLSNYSCPLNKDVEQFLREKAILFAKQGISATHLVFTSYKGEPVLVGYFTLAFKHLAIKYSVKINSKLRGRLKKFGTYNAETKTRTIVAPLIAQLGKNYANGYNQLITGDELLDMACQKVGAIFHLGGGKVAYLECEDTPQLLQFYRRNGFVDFDRRPLDKDEEQTLSTSHLVQMLRYFS